MYFEGSEFRWVQIQPVTLRATERAAASRGASAAAAADSDSRARTTRTGIRRGPRACSPRATGTTRVAPAEPVRRVAPADYLLRALLPAVPPIHAVRAAERQSARESRAATCSRELLSLSAAAYSNSYLFHIQLDFLLENTCSAQKDFQLRFTSNSKIICKVN